MAEGVFYAGAASFQCSRSRILSVRPEPHPLTAVGAVKRCGSGAKPGVQNRTIKKKQDLRSRIILMRLRVKNFDAGAGGASRSGYGSTKMMRLGSTTMEKTVPLPRFETCLLC
jgi:hypothetical protein